MQIIAPAFDQAWFDLLNSIYSWGSTVNPRGLECRELQNVQLTVKNARASVLISPIRNLNYRFMVAEWLWIWFGLRDVATIARYNENMRKFSDDGLALAGAYGPLFRKWFSHFIKTLQTDADSRQAVISFWTTPKDGSKDVPCTLTLQGLIRNGSLHLTVNMRSSDIWLGLPYDFFTFSQIGNATGALLRVPFASLTYNLASSHLYRTNFDEAYAVLLAKGSDISHIIMQQLWSQPPIELLQVLQNDTNAPPIYGEYKVFSDVLRAPSRKVALEVLIAAAIA